MPLAPRLASSLLAPPRCPACGAGCCAWQGLCARCAEGLRSSVPLVDPGPAGVDLSVAAAPYAGAARSLAHALKFARALSPARLAAEAIAAACPPGEMRGEIVPVPPAPWRRRWRGFDPAEEIAIALSKLTGLPLRRCLRRRSGPRQLGRPRSERLTDPPRVSVRRPGSTPAHALLIDDVQTTGATLAACAAALREAGSHRIVALTLARSVSRVQQPLRLRSPNPAE